MICQNFSFFSIEVNIGTAQQNHFCQASEHIKENFTWLVVSFENLSRVSQISYKMNWTVMSYLIYESSFHKVHMKWRRFYLTYEGSFNKFCTKWQGEQSSIIFGAIFRPKTQIFNRKHYTVKGGVVTFCDSTKQYVFCEHMISCNEGMKLPTMQVIW